MTSAIVIPTYNEAANVPHLVAALLALPGCSILVVDDDSPDGTGRIADKLAVESNGRLSVLHRPCKQGLGTAYVEGFRLALRTGAEYVLQMDADFSHDPADVPRLIEAAERADVAIGSRYVAGGGSENWPVLRRVMSRGGSLYVQLVLGLPIQDPTGGFKCFRRDALERVDLDQVRANGFGFQLEVNWRCHQLGMRLVEVPIRFVDRKLGQSKMSRQIFFEACWLVWALRLGGGAHPKSPEMTAL